MHGRPVSLRGPAQRRQAQVARPAFPPSLSPQEAKKLGIEVVPFGDGGADNESARVKIYTHGPCRSGNAAEYIVAADRWKDAPAGGDERRAIVERTLEKLRAYGFVVLEHLLPVEKVASLEAEAARYLGSTPDGFVTQPLRANRTQLHLPYEAPWAGDWLVKHELVLEVVARYVCNNMAGGRTEEEQQWSWVQWVTAGTDLDWFRMPENGFKRGELLESPPSGCTDVGRPDVQGPWLGRVMVTKTPPQSPAQKRHRDIILPGPAAQLTIQVALTPLEANNGPLGYVPTSHKMNTPGFEVVANPPLGSIVLYDSFLEHHGIENDSPRDRYAMYYEFETRGIFSGYTDEHFGTQAAAHTFAFRNAVDPELRRWVDYIGSAA